jgi:hypothetical protein
MRLFWNAIAKASFWKSRKPGFSPDIYEWNALQSDHTAKDNIYRVRCDFVSDEKTQAELRE